VNQRDRASMPNVVTGAEREQFQAAVGAWSTVVLVAAVNLIWGVAKLLTGKGQLSGINLMIFTLGGLTIIGWLGLLTSSYRPGALFALLARTTQTGPVEGDDGLLNNGAHVGPGRFQRAISNLWVPVTFQFWLVGWLIYASGGITSSPYVPVPVAMMIIGQSLYHVRPIGLRAEAKLRDVLAFLWRVACFYGYPQLMFGSLLIALAMLHEYLPLAASPAPIAETIVIMQLSVSIGLCVAFIVRRVDRAATPDTG
jgi:hypothetical protein